MPSHKTCQIGSLFHRCKAPVAGVCQYCGRAFCREHGVFLEDSQEICVREPCQAKRFDLEKHLIWKARSYQRNAADLCGMEDCEREPWGQCSKCRALFCTVHLREREQTVRQGRTTIVKRASTCDHCWQRRTIWMKV